MMEFVIMLVFNRKAVAGTWTMSSRYRVGIHPLCKPSYLGWQMQRYVLSLCMVIDPIRQHASH